MKIPKFVQRIKEFVSPTPTPPVTRKKKLKPVTVTAAQWEQIGFTYIPEIRRVVYYDGDEAGDLLRDRIYGRDHLTEKEAAILLEAMGSPVSTDEILTPRAAIAIENARQARGQREAHAIARGVGAEGSLGDMHRYVTPDHELIARMSAIDAQRYGRISLSPGDDTFQ